MNFEIYTDRARGFVQSAQGLALREGHQQFTPEHLLKVLLDDSEGLAAGLIRKAGGQSQVALNEAEQDLRLPPSLVNETGRFPLLLGSTRTISRVEMVSARR